MSHSALPCFPLEILILMRQHPIREESTGQWIFYPIMAYLSPTLTYYRLVFSSDSGYFSVGEITLLLKQDEGVRNSRVPFCKEMTAST